MAPRVALITGASSGIGWATARRLAADGYLTVLVARREDRLQELASVITGDGGTALVIAADLGQEKDRQRLFEEVNALVGTVSVLVNDAGFGWYGYASDMPWPMAREMIELNAATVVHLTLLFLPQMMARNRGHIINVGSVAGSLGAQGVAVYGGTKAFLSSFTRALHRELRGTGVHASLVQAGIVTGTEFYSSLEARRGSMRVPAGSIGVTRDQVAKAIAGLVRRPRKVTYVPAIVRGTILVEPLFGWALDVAGPLHLRRASKNADRSARPRSSP